MQFPGRRRIRDEPKIYIPVVPGDWQTPTLAQLDTGAAWSVLDTEIAEDLGLFNELGEHTNLSTRLGSMEGILVRTPFTLVAEEGTSLRIDATVFISRDWQEGTFLGYGACWNESVSQSTRERTISSSVPALSRPASRT